MSNAHHAMVQVLLKTERAENLKKRAEMLKDAGSKIFYAINGTDLYGDEEAAKVQDWLKRQEGAWELESFNLKFEVSELIKEYKEDETE